MADKEMRRLKRRELLRMLVVQCEETERLQQEAAETRARLNELEESYERLKEKLNIKDERLNQKDAQIAALRQTIEELRTSKEIELREAGSIAEAALRLNGIFEAAQEAADQYLMNVKKYADTGGMGAAAPPPSEAGEERPDEGEPAPSAAVRVVPLDTGERKNSLIRRWGPDTRRRLLHG